MINKKRARVLNPRLRCTIALSLALLVAVGLRSSWGVLALASDRDAGRAFAMAAQAGMITDTPVPSTTPTVTPWSTLVGHINWQGAAYYNRPNMVFSLTLKMGAFESNYINLNTDRNGFFTITLGYIPPGTYTWRIKSFWGPGTYQYSRHLANSGIVSFSSTSFVNVEMGLMKAGDVTDDNVVTISDFNVLKNEFGLASRRSADFDSNQVVNASDFNLLKSNFGLGGAPPISPGSPYIPLDTETPIITPTATDTPTPSNTHTITLTPTSTNTHTPSVTGTPPMLVGHVTWQSIVQPNTRNQMPITLTLKIGDFETNYPAQLTDNSGFFTVPVGSLPSGVYSWRVKSRFPNGGLSRHIANSGTVTLTGEPLTNLEMRLMKAGDINNDNVVATIDFAIMKNDFGQSGIRNADFDNNFVTNATDFNMLKGNFGLGGAPPVNPERRDIPLDTETPTPTVTEMSTNTPTPTPTGVGVLYGHLTWQQVLAANRPSVTGTLSLCAFGAPHNYSFTTDAGGNFTVTTGLTDGVYQWRVRGGRHISRASPIDGPAIAIAGGVANREFGTQKGGDANASNSVNTVDFTIMVQRDGPAVVPAFLNRAADFDYNLVVNASDFNVLRNNYGQAGNPLVCP